MDYTGPQMRKHIEVTMNDALVGEEEELILEEAPENLPAAFGGDNSSINSKILFLLFFYFFYFLIFNSFFSFTLYLSISISISISISL